MQSPEADPVKDTAPEQQSEAKRNRLVASVAMGDIGYDAQKPERQAQKAAHFALTRVDL